MSGECSCHARDEMDYAYKHLENLWGRDYFRDLGIDGRIILKYIIISRN
jgi:hypothetical protein